MNPRNALACSLLAMVSACAAPTSSGPAPAARTQPVSQPVRGVATYVERVKMPAGASLRVELLDAASGAPVATSLVRDVGGPPIGFTIARPSAPPPAGGYALRAALLGPRGERWFATATPVGAPVGGDSVELRMRRVADEAAAATASSRDTLVAHWECGELGVMSRYDRRNGAVRLSFNGRVLDLPIARAASGARYADAHANEFWTKGATGQLALAGEPARDCVEAAQPSPWNEAAQRGVGFRAVGNEPGWFAELSGEPATLDATLDYGEHTLRAVLTPVHGGFDGTADGKPLRLRVERTRCTDGMSGQAFEASVSLDALGRNYRGCGAWLQD
jgi:uncharacterized membrane protein/uncharacterized lipoprotein YbaY